VTGNSAEEARALRANRTLRLGLVGLLAVMVGTTASAAGEAGASAEGERTSESRGRGPIQLPAGRELTPAMARELAEAARRARPEPVTAPEHRAEPGDLPPQPPVPRVVQPQSLQLDSGAKQAEADLFAYAPRLSISFLGHDKDGSPADALIAAGPSQLVAVVNTQIAYFSKSGTNLQELDFSNTTQPNFFGLASTDPGTFDPKIVFDPYSQRYFFIAVSVGATPSVGSFFHLAVSLTSNPGDGWCIYPPVRNDLGNEWLDYPGLGVSQRALYLTGIYQSGDSNFPGWPTATPDRRNTLWVADKAPLLTCGGTGIWPLDDVTSSSEGMRVLKPSLTFGTPPGPEAFVCAYDPAPSPPRGLVMGVNLPVDFPASPPTVTKRWVNLPPIDSGMANAPQQGGPALIATNNLGPALMNAAYRSGRLWTIHHPQVGGLTVARPVEYDVSTWPNPTLASSGDYTDLTSFYYWPAVAVNASGDAIMVFGRSSAAEFASARWSLRFAGDANFRASQYLKAGMDYYGTSSDTGATVYRWGDYGGAAVDPVDQGFWITHQFAQTRLFGTTPNWNTWIGYVPRAVFVDAGFVGTEQGTRSAPWNTVGEGHADAFGNNDLVIRTGSYPESVTLDKPLRIFADGGPVTIGQ
jgi:hypothetical protein